MGDAIGQRSHLAYCPIASFISPASHCFAIGEAPYTSSARLRKTSRSTVVTVRPARLQILEDACLVGEASVVVLLQRHLGRGDELGAVRFGQLVEDRLRDIVEHRLDQMRGQHNLLRHLVELRGIEDRERVLLPVDRAGLERKINLGHAHRHRRDTDRLPEQQPFRIGRHAHLHPRKIRRPVHIALRAQVDLARAEIADGEDLDPHLVRDRLAVFVAELAIEQLAEMRVVADQVASIEKAVLRELLCDLERGAGAHLQIATLQRGDFSALSEQRARRDAS